MIDTEREYQELFNIYWPIALFFIVLIWGLIAVFVWRYRVGRKAPVSKIHEDDRKEGLYVAVLTLIAAALVFFTLTTMYESQANLPADSGTGFDETEAAKGAETPPALTEVRFTGARWNWRFDYPEYGATVVGTGTDVPTLVVPQGNVRFVGTSIDVMHGFFIPALRFKREVFPERQTAFTLGFPETGTLERGGSCSEYCGLRHAYMEFDVRVLPPAEFERWARRQAQQGEA